MSDNVIQFRPRQPAGIEDPILYATLYPSSTILHDPTTDEPDKDDMARRMFDATAHVMADANRSLMLISIGVDATITLRSPDIFETPAQRAWFRRRLDDVYASMTGCYRNPIRAFFSRLNPFKGRPQ